MTKRYHATKRTGLGTDRAAANAGQTRVKPLKRPVQARARSTVEAIYAALVRILRKNGWQAVTTRAVATDAGISIGTLYEYFPNKLAILSGYERHAVDALLERIEKDVIARSGDWRARLGTLARLTADPRPADLPYFDRAMLLLENDYAEPKHHRRVYEELSHAWRRAVDACPDLPARPANHQVEAAFSAALGARRYIVLAAPRNFDRRRWLEDIERMCVGLLSGMLEEPRKQEAPQDRSGGASV